MSKEKETIINGIDISECFTNHYDNSGKLYAVEYKGNPLKLQNAIKRLQQENKKLKEVTNEAIIEHENLLINRNDFAVRAEKYKQALEEIREIAKICMSKDIDSCYTCEFSNECEIEDEEIPTRDVCKLIKNKIDEVLK